MVDLHRPTTQLSGHVSDVGADDDVDSGVTNRSSGAVKCSSRLYGLTEYGYAGWKRRLEHHPDDSSLNDLPHDDKCVD